MATKITTDDIETYLEGLGKHDSKGKVHFERVLFSIKTLKSGVKIVLDSPDTEPVLKNFKSKMIKTLMGEFKGGLIAGGAMVAEKTMNFLGQNVTADQILARSRGQILNPNAELLFSGPVLRQFSFTFLLLARSKREGSEIRKIIRTFKEGAVPKHVNDALLTNPDIWQLTYKRNDRELKTVNKFGAMGLTTITVDYAPEGFWTAYEDSQPVACRLNLEFGEVRPLYQQDYEGSSDSVGY